MELKRFEAYHQEAIAIGAIVAFVVAFLLGHNLGEKRAFEKFQCFKNDDSLASYCEDEYQCGSRTLADQQKKEAEDKKLLDDFLSGH